MASLVAFYWGTVQDDPRLSTAVANSKRQSGDNRIEVLDLIFLGGLNAMDEAISQASTPHGSLTYAGVTLG